MAGCEWYLLTEALERKDRENIIHSWRSIHLALLANNFIMKVLQKCVCDFSNVTGFTAQGAYSRPEFESYISVYFENRI